jgi:hypothetical protein
MTLSLTLMTLFVNVILILHTFLPWTTENSMGKKQQTEKFYIDLQAKNNLDKCPFLLGWFKAKLDELYKLPDEHDRSGIAKGERLPVPKMKRILALHDIVFKKFRLKVFCELKGVNHGTGRNWRNTDKIFGELALGFAEEFSHAFLQRYSELIESGRLIEASKLINECRHYPAVSVEQIIIQLERYGDQKISEPISFDSLTTLNRFHPLLFSILRMSLKDKVADRRDDAQALMSKELQAIDVLYEEIRKKYKDPGTQEALNFAETHAYQSLVYLNLIISEFME